MGLKKCLDLSAKKQQNKSIQQEMKYVLMNQGMGKNTPKFPLFYHQCW